MSIDEKIEQEYSVELEDEHVDIAIVNNVKYGRRVKVTKYSTCDKIDETYIGGRQLDKVFKELKAIYNATFDTQKDCHYEIGHS